MFIKDLSPGSLFTMPLTPRQELSGVKPTIYRAERVTVGAPGQGTQVVYSIPGAPSVGECQMVGPSLTTVNPKQMGKY